MMDQTDQTDRTDRTDRADRPPRRAQLAPAKLLRMSLGSLRHHFVGSLLQVCTIAATAAFLTYVLGEMATMRAIRVRQIDFTPPEGAMAQLVWILVVALLVCTISNVTSMLLSVSKRFREIGTMKCLGAFDQSVLVLFLVEAMILGGTGALGGALLGGLFSLLLAVVRFGGAVICGALLGGLLGGVVVTFFTVVILSFAGAAYPAFQASRMLPIEAMRSSN
jgi:hypothetical protein